MNKKSNLMMPVTTGFEGPFWWTAKIRKIKPDDPEEMRRISLIDKCFDVLKEMAGRQLNDKELVDFVTDNERKILYVVSGGRLVTKSEVGKLQGWILVYTGQEVRQRAERALKRKFPKNDWPILEVSYAKYPGAVPKQMACGLRQVLLAVARKDGVDLREEGLNYQRLVTAFIDAENIRSQHVLEASGFILQSKRVLWSLKESKKEDLVYVLDWHCLRRKLYF